MATIFKITKLKLALSVILFLICGYILLESLVTYAPPQPDINTLMTLNNAINLAPILIMKLMLKLNLDYLVDTPLFIIPFALAVLMSWSYFLICIFIAILQPLKNNRMKKI